MIRIGVVYSIVRDLCNKDQKGFVTPAVFNTLAEAAQMNVYNEMFNELKLANRLRASGSDAGRDKSAYKMVEEDLSYFIRSRKLDLTSDEDQVLDEDGVTVVSEESEAKVAKPEDLGRIISMNVFEENTSVEIVYDAEKAKRILNSNLSAPTREFPVALVDGYYIEVFPNEISEDVTLKYYRTPVKPFLQVTEVGGLQIENIDDSINFELPAHYLSEVVGEIARMIGVRLRDDVLMQYGTAEITNK
jgi:hypothetical protein